MVPAFCAAGLQPMPVQVIRDGGKAAAFGPQFEHKPYDFLFLRDFYELSANHAVAIRRDADMPPNGLN